MNRKLLIALVLVVTSSLTYAQRKEKIKGNKIVTTKQINVEAFSRILIGEDLKVDLVKGENPSVEIKTDENLHDIIISEVLDNTLVIKTTQKITSKKALEIRITYTDALNLIETKEDGEIRSITTIDIPELTVKAAGSSRLYLTLKSDLFKFINSDKSKAELNVTANSTTLELSDSSKLEALINSTDIKVDLYQRADAKIEGDVDTLNIRADNNTNFIGKNLTANTCRILAEGSTDIYVQVVENINIEASGSSEIYLYENPKITITKFSDTVILHKKEL